MGGFGKRILMLSGAMALAVIAAFAIYVFTGAPQLDVKIHYGLLDPQPWRLISIVYLVANAIGIFSTFVAVYLAMTRKTVPQ